LGDIGQGAGLREQEHRKCRRPACVSLAPCSRPSRPLRAAFGGGLRPVLTAPARGTIDNLQAGTKERLSARTKEQCR
jgi:hypothetical protein